MAAVTGAIKYSLRYTASTGNEGAENITKTVSGLNIGASGVSDSGPNRDRIVGVLIQTLGDFSTGVNKDFRWLSEQGVTL